MTVCAVGITAAIAAAGLKKNTPEISILAAAAGGILILLTILPSLSPLTEEMQELMELTDLDPDNAAILLKTMGICLAGKFTSEFCQDNGYSSLGSKVEFAAKISVLIIAIPLYRTLLEIAADFFRYGTY